jgi:pyruvate dehydrogenase E1 component alpha subunit
MAPLHEAHPYDHVLEDCEVLLDPAGARVAGSRLDSYVEELDGDRLRGLYRDMSILRRIDTEGVSLQRQGQLGLWPPCRGQEAAQIGTVRALRDDDFLFTSYRELGLVYARGGAPGDFVRMWRGESGSGHDPAELSIAPMQIVIGAQTLHAVGYALGISIDGGEQISAAYFGDGATSEGDVNEALVFAASYEVPAVFMCQNNQWAISEPVALQSKYSLAQRAAGFGVPSIRIDGNDVLACFAAMRWAADHARSGRGPAFIEAVTYRLGPHTTADDPTRYRSADELEAWTRRDPLLRLETHLREIDALDDDQHRQILADGEQLAMDMRAACISMETPPPLSLFDHVYAEPHRELARQRDAYAAYLSSFEPEDDQ